MSSHLLQPAMTMRSRSGWRRRCLRRGSWRVARVLGEAELATAEKGRQAYEEAVK
jgi:hypothetical protein